MKTSLMCLSALVLVAGCNKPAPAPQADANEAATAGLADAAGKMQPGEYSIKMEMTKFDVPGLPAAQAEQMKKQMASGMAGKTFCLTAEQAAKGSEEMFKRMGQGDCKFDKYNNDGGNVAGTMTCAMQGGMAMTVNFTGSTTPTGTVSDSETTMKTPMGQMTTASHVEMTRVGDCKA